MTASEQLNIVFYKLANDSAAVLAPKSLPTAAPKGVPVAGQASTNKAVVKSYPKAKTTSTTNPVVDKALDFQVRAPTGTAAARG